VLLNIRTTPKSDSNVSAAEVLYGMTLTLPAQLAASDETASAEVDRQRTATAIPTQRLPQSLPTWVPAHLSAAEAEAEGPSGTTIQWPVPGTGQGFQVLHSGGGGSHRLKPHTGQTAATPAAPLTIDGTGTTSNHYSKTSKNNVG
jgi:hypothetical protein